MSVVIPIVNKGQHPEHNTLVYENDEPLLQMNDSASFKRPLHQHYA